MNEVDSSGKFPGTAGEETTEVEKTVRETTVQETIVRETTVHKTTVWEETAGQEKTMWETTGQEETVRETTFQKKTAWEKSVETETAGDETNQDRIWLEKCLDFVREAEGLKSTLRTAWTESGRHESTAEHSWRLALLAALCLAKYPELDGKRVLLLCLVHDIGELYDGDISAALGADEAEKHRGEKEAVERAGALLPDEQFRQLLELWSEYNEASTPEARLVKALDKAETILQHSQGMNPPDFDYAFNLTYGKDYFMDGGFLEQMRNSLDQRTVERMTRK